MYSVGNMLRVSALLPLGKNKKIPICSYFEAKPDDGPLQPKHVAFIKRNIVSHYAVAPACVISVM